MKKIIIPFAIFALFIANSLEAATIKVWHEMHDNAPSAVNAEGILKASPDRKKIIIPFAIFALFIDNSLEAATIKVWHEMHDNAPSAVNAEGILKASPNAIWETLIRFNDFAKFMPRVRESFFITQEGVDALKKTKTNHINKIQEIARLYKTDDHRLKGGKWEGFVFMVLNTPFPVTNRWYILHT